MATIDGTAGDDDLTGTSGADLFNLVDGGEDTAHGGGGNDAFDMGATLDAGDHIDGGTGKDEVTLHGDYSAGLAFTSTMLTRIEQLGLAPGFDYVLTGIGQVATKGFTVYGRGIGVDDHILADASDATELVKLRGGKADDTLIGGASHDEIFGGGGDNSLVGGDGSDRFFGAQDGVDLMDGGAGGDTFVFVRNYSAADTLVGGTGDDTLVLDHGPHHGVVFALDSLQSVEAIHLIDGAYDLTLDDANVAAGETLTVDVALGENASMRFDGSAELDGTLHLIGGSGHDTLIGGAGNDTLFGGGGGGDKLVGGFGADVLEGRDISAERFAYLSVADSVASGPDLIIGLDGSDLIDLKRIDADVANPGNQAFHLAASFTGHAGELVVSYDAGHDLTDIMGDVDGDSTADLIITAQGDHSGFTGFVL